MKLPLVCRLVMMLASVVLHAAPMISLQPMTINATVGNSILLDIVFTDANDLYAYGFDVGFDPLVLQVIGLTSAGFLVSGGSVTFNPGTVNNSAGTVASTVESLQGPVAGVTGSGSLVHLQFNSVGTGSSVITIFNQLFLDSSLSGIDVSVSSASVVVRSSAVPEPHTISLGALGVCFLFVYGYLSRKSVMGR